MKKALSAILALVLVLSMSVVGFAATSQVTVLDGVYTEIYNVTFGAGTDTFHSMTHGLGALPEMISIVPFDVNCSAVLNVASALGSGMPYVNDLTTARVGIEKNSIAQSATCVVRVTVQTVHSIIR